MPVNIDLLDDLSAAADETPELRALADEYRRSAGGGDKLVALKGPQGWLLLLLDRTRTRGRGSLIGDPGDDVMTAMAAALRDGGVAEVVLERLTRTDAAGQAFRAAGWKVTGGEESLIAHNPRTLKGLWSAAAALVGRKRSR